MDQAQIQQAIETLRQIEDQITSGKMDDPGTKNLLMNLQTLLSEAQIIEKVNVDSGDEPNFDTQLDEVLGNFDKVGQGIADPAERLQMHLEVGDTLYRLGRRKEAQSHYESAQEIAVESNEPLSEADALRRIGRLKRRQGRWQQARKALTRAAGIYRKLDHTGGEAEAVLNIGNIEFEVGDYEKAEIQFQKALALCADPGDTVMTANINLSLGTVHQVRGSAEEAIAHYTASLDAFEALGDDMRAGHTHFNLGISYREAGAWEKAGLNYEKSLKLARKHRDMGQIGMIYLRRAETQVLISDAAMAVSYGRRAMRIFIRVEDPLGQADAYRVYGQAATIRRAWDQAHDYLTESLKLQRKYKSPLGEAETLEAWGQFYEGRQDFEEALNHYEAAQNIFQNVKAAGDEKRLEDVIGQVKLTMTI